MKLLVFGGGAIGSFYFWRLKTALPSAHIAILCRSNYEAVKKHGFDIKSYMENAVVVPDLVYGSTEDVKREINESKRPYDYVFLATKGSCKKEISSDLLDGIITPGHTCLVLMQNGIGIEQIYRNAFRNTPIITSILLIMIEMKNLREVIHVSNTRTFIGPYYASKEEQKASENGPDITNPLFHLKKIDKIFTDGGINSLIYEDPKEIQAVRWGKLILNAIYGGTQVLTCYSTVSDMWSQDLEYHTTKSIDEIIEAGRKIFGSPFPRKYCPTADSMRRLALNSSSKTETVSFTRDWIDGRESELDIILGNMIKVANSHNHEMPRCETMYYLMKAYKHKSFKKPEKPINYGTGPVDIILFPE